MKLVVSRSAASRKRTESERAIDRVGGAPRRQRQPPLPSRRIHVSETDSEIGQSLERFGLRDLPYLESIGFLGPDVLAVHCVQCDQHDIDTRAEHDVKVSHNPRRDEP